MKPTNMFQKKVNTELQTPLIPFTEISVTPYFFSIDVISVIPSPSIHICVEENCILKIHENSVKACTDD